MTIKILKPGLQSTIQDPGRTGWMHLGISRSGVMDPLSAKLANYILDVPAHQAVVEMTQTGIDIEVSTPIDIVISGAKMLYELNGEAVGHGEKLALKPGDQLRYIKTLSGFRAYMAFSRALDVPAFLGSYATQLNAGLGGFQGRALRAGDELAFIEQSASTHNAHTTSQPEYLGHYQIRITQSPESGQFSKEQERDFCASSYRVTPELNRMGIRLSGKTIHFSDYPHMPSRGLVPGTIQVPPDGQPIIAGMDAQTTGGYLRIGQVIEADMPIIGQLKPGDSVDFVKLETELAQQIYLKQQQIFSA